MFEVALPPSIWRVVDFGCGTCEFGRWAEHKPHVRTYCGVDLDTSHADTMEYPGFHVIQGDYREVDLPCFDVAVSLFSTELHLPPQERQDMYEGWFRNGVRCALVSGFVYDRYPTDEVVGEEVGGLCYQAIDPLRCSSPLYTERRIECRVPPGMFGEPFTEVWKILLPKVQS